MQIIFPTLLQLFQIRLSTISGRPLSLYVCIRKMSTPKCSQCTIHFYGLAHFMLGPFSTAIKKLGKTQSTENEK